MLEYLFAQQKVVDVFAGLISSWEFASNYDDTGGAAKHGAGTNVYFTEFKGKPCLAFEGAGFVDIPAFVIGTGPWTFSTWIAGYDWDASYQHILTAAVQSNFALKIAKPFSNTPGGTPYFHSTLNGAGSLVASKGIPLNTWEMVTFSFDGQSKLRIYIGATLDREFTMSALNVPSTKFRVGNSETTAGEFNRGWLRGLKYWGRVLPASEVMALYNLTK